MPAITTVHPPISLTTILIPSLQPEYEKLPTLKPANKPVSESLEKTTTMAPTTNAPPTAGYTTIVYNQTAPYQQSSAMTETSAPPPTTTAPAEEEEDESADKFTTEYKIGDWNCL